MSIKRSLGVIVPGWAGPCPGGGYKGATPELDAYVVEAANLPESVYPNGVEIRFNSDRQSGGAFLKGLSYSVGINAKLWDLADHKKFCDKYPGIVSFEESCKRNDLDPNGPQFQITFGCFIAAAALKPDHGLAYLDEDRKDFVCPGVPSVADGLALIRRVVKLPMKEGVE